MGYSKQTQKSFGDITEIAALAANLMADMANAYESKSVGKPAEAANLRKQIAELWAPIADAKKSISETVAPHNSMLPQDKIKGFEDAAAAKITSLLTVFGNNLPEHARILLGALGVTEVHAANKTSPNGTASQLIGNGNSSRGLGYTGTPADSSMAGNIASMIEAEKCPGPRPRSSRADQGVGYISDFSKLCPVSDSANGGVAIAARQIAAGMGSR